MTKSQAEIKFENSKKLLANNLKNLEEITKNKINEASLNAKIIASKSYSNSDLQTKILEQETIIYRLNCEINNLQNNLSQLGDEIENLREEKNNLSQKLKKISEKNEKIYTEINDDILEIEKLINHDA